MSELPLGVVDQSPVRNGGTAEDAVCETLELARVCERLGYGRYWLAEHHSTNSFAGSSPAVLIPRVAAVTERMRIGSGGVLLTHDSPYRVAERFRMAEILAPGRIDLGVGRAPGGTGRAAAALRYGRNGIPVERFPEQVADLLEWLRDGFEDGHPWRRVRATPRSASAPPVWVLGSGGGTARVAGELGRGYAFAQFISGRDAAPAFERYRRHFEPSDDFAEPRTILAVGAICGETEEEAVRLALSTALWRMRIVRGVDRGIPTPEQAEAEFAEAGFDLDEIREELRNDPRVLTGDPAGIGERIGHHAERCGADEVMIVTVTWSREARIRSYERIAEVMGTG
ncbi:MAG: LLM class flavin-dependent oxidoreductase [Gemmatimonadota bacterium]